MKLLLINEVCGHTSTGKICAELAEKYEADGYEVKIAYGRDDFVPEKYQRFAVRIGTARDVRAHAILTRITDKHGLGSVGATRKFLQWASAYDPDVVWLHNLHGYYINYPLLFQWIKSRPNLKVKWTLHDCWAFTGHCPHFTVSKCEQWKAQCMCCPERVAFPKDSLFNRCKRNFQKKKNSYMPFQIELVVCHRQMLIMR